MTPVTDLLARRDQVRAELAEGDRHVLAILREPEVAMRAVPVGDVLCWTNGLNEHAVTRVLQASEIPWGRRLSQLSARDVAMVCFQIKARHPETWEHWREMVAERGVAT